MDFMKKLNLEANKLTQKVKDKANNVSVDAKVFEQERKIKELVVEIGNLTVKSMDDGAANFNEAIKEKYDAILEIRKVIEELKSQKVETEVEAPVICPSCGKVVADGMKFCGNCGAKVEVEVEATAEEVVEESKEEDKED